MLILSAHLELSVGVSTTETYRWRMMSGYATIKSQRMDVGQAIEHSLTL